VTLPPEAALAAALGLYYDCVPEDEAEEDASVILRWLLRKGWALIEVPEAEGDGDPA
jgi:hypothetical protein